MNGFGFFNIAAGLLQLFVPSYALRLVRRFGAPRVGWFIVAAFVSLALLHLLQPARLYLGAISVHTPNVIFALASGLLLIGMTHLETLLSERAQLKRQQQEVQAALEAKVNERTAELAETNRELAEEIARREQKEKALRESEAQYRFLFAEMPQPMWIFDLRTLQFLTVNQAALRCFGMDYQEFMALTAKDLLAANAVAAFLEDAAKPCTRGQSRGVWQHCRKDLSVRALEITARDLKFGGRPARLVLAQDVTQVHPHELGRSRDENCEIIGRVAGGFAHHFNNILTIIDGHTNLLLRDSHDPKTTAQLTQIAAAANRAATLTRQLVAAGGRQLVRPEPVDLNAVIQTQDQLLKRLVGGRIAIQTTLAETLPLVLAERKILEHILIHLILNAREALSEGGSIEIRTSCTRFNESQANQHPDAKPGEFVQLTVRDNGCGMTPEIQAHVFEPFFTTHDIGKGTGLGLASVHGEVKQLSGWIEFSSRVGVGTEFSIFLPCAPKVAAEPIRQTPQASATAWRGTVLLVEPEDRARAVARYLLNRQGYRVIEADSMKVAEVLWEGQCGKIDLLLTDLNLGDSSGQELVRRLRQTRPDLNVVFAANPSPEGEENEELYVAGAEIIAKPYNQEKLLKALQAAWPKTSERTLVSPEHLAQQG